MRKTFLFILVSLTMLTASCSDDECPVITGVRKIEKADSLFTECKPGEKVVLIGERLHGLKSVTVNGQRCDYNTAYLTDHSIICTIPSDITTVAKDSTLPAQFEVVTDHGCATYPFYVLSPNPVLDSFYADFGYADDGTLTLNGGQLVHLNGKNFYDIERIYITTSLDEAGARTKTIDQYQVNDDKTLIHLLLPSRIFSSGWFVVQCRQGTAALPFNVVVAGGSNDDENPSLPALTEEDGMIENFK